jgi:hypothetical protein
MHAFRAAAMVVLLKPQLPAEVYQLLAVLYLAALFLQGLTRALGVSNAVLQVHC